MLFEIAALFAVFNITEGATKKECQKVSHRKNSNCDNIYIWGGGRKEFVSLSNSTLIDTPGSSLGIPEGITVRVIAVNMLPYITSSNSSDELGGYLGEIWSVTSAALKFKSQISLLQSPEYYNGERSMEKGLGDVLLSATVAFKSRNIRFTQPLFSNWYHLYMKKPKARASPAPYLRSFDLSLWLASISLLVVLMCLVYITSRVMRRHTKEERYVSLSTCLLTVFGGILNQGYDAHIKSVSGRLLVFISLVFGLLIYSSMNAVLVSHLAISELELPFQALEDIALRSTHSLCVRTNNYVYKNFTDGNRTLLPTWNGIVNAGACLDITDQENIAKVICNDNVVVLENRVVISTVQRRARITCQLAFLNTKLFPRANPFMIYKKFQYRKQIAITLTKLKNYGILHRIEKKWMGEPFVNNQDQVKSPVTLHHIEGLLVLLVFMTAFSLIILTAEILVYNRNTRNTAVSMQRKIVFTRA